MTAQHSANEVDCRGVYIECMRSGEERFSIWELFCSLSLDVCRAPIILSLATHSICTGMGHGGARERPVER